MLHLTDRVDLEPITDEASLPLSVHPVPTTLRTHLVAMAIAVGLVAIGMVTGPPPPDDPAGQRSDSGPAAVAQP